MRNVWGRFGVLMLAVMTAAFVLSASGCVMLESDEPPEWSTGEEAEENVEVAEEETEDGPGGAHHGKEVLMMGRSVMEGWFTYWGWDWEGPIQDRGYVIYYHALEGPPGIGSDAASQIDDVPDGTTVFFKLCFDDFWASSAGDVQPMTDEALGWVDEVIAASEGRDIDLILGNALPKVRQDTNANLVKQHRAYNEGLEARAAARDNIWVFDQYSILAGSDGTLPRGLAVSPDDSHLNTTAYSALDAEYFPLLDEITGGME